MENEAVERDVENEKRKRDRESIYLLVKFVKLLLSANVLSPDSKEREREGGRGAGNPR